MVKNHSGFKIIITLYTTFILVWIVARILFFDQFWPVALLNTIAQYLFVPLPILLIITVWNQDSVSFAKLTIPSIIFVILFSYWFWPLLPKQIDNDEQLITVMSFNILYSNQNHKAIIDSIRFSKPDIVGFQELTQTSAQSIENHLQADYPYSTLPLLKPGQSAGLLSKFPIKQVEWFDLPPLDIALHTTVWIKGRTVHVFVVHLSPNNFFDHSITEFVPLVKERYKRRKNETIQLKQIVQGTNGPILLLCDCNMTDTSEAYVRLNTVLNDSFRQVGWGLGHTFQPPHLFFPIQRIDYVWYSDDFTPIQAYVGIDGRSDHLPIVATVRLNP